MKKIHNAIIKNPFITENKNSISHSLIEESLDDISFNKNGEQSSLKSFRYLLVTLDYGDWASQPDVFEFISKKYLRRIQKNKCFFIFDASMEGWSPSGRYCIFEYLYRSCKLHNIDPKMVIYLTSNLEDEKNIKTFAKIQNSTPFHVLSYPAFEYFVTHSNEGYNPVTNHRYTADELLNAAEQRCHEKFKGKLFSSLSRVNRGHRVIGTFILCQNPISKQALISHDNLNNDFLNTLHIYATDAGYTNTDVKNWNNQLPLTIDHSNFEENWAENSYPYQHIHDQTIFQIVNETHSDSVNNTSMFYSEKTFRPILNCQPFVIFGQPGCNHRLKELGYKLYDEWFDLSFDFIEDEVLRYQNLLKSVQRACAHLNSMSRKEQIAWRFKNKEILLHNCQVLHESEYARNKFRQLLTNINQ